jgi:hypothetical protein
MNDELIITAIFLIMGVAFVLIPIRFILLRNKMLQIGIRTMATVVDVQVGQIVRNKSGQVNRKYTYTLEYVADYTRITKKSTSTTISQDYVIGDKVEIAYFPDNPKSIMFGYNLTDSPLNKIGPAVFVAVGAILIIVSAIMLFK